MRTHDLLKRLLYVRQDFDEVLEKPADADLPWRPADDMPSIAGLLIEIANKEKEMIGCKMANGQTTILTPSTNWRHWPKFASFSQPCEQTLRYIDSFDEAGLEELVPCPEQWWEALRLDACPRSEILRNVAAHEWYHTGQLIVYQSMRALVPDDKVTPCGAPLSHDVPMAVGYLPLAVLEAVYLRSPQRVAAGWPSIEHEVCSRPAV